MTVLAPHEIEPRDYLFLQGWPISAAELKDYQPDIDRAFHLDDSSYEEDLLGRLRSMRVFPRDKASFRARWVKMLPARRRDLRDVIRKLQRRDNVELWLGATVTGFEVDPSTARLSAIQAVDHGGRTLTVRADHFIAAAGTIETTRVLLLLDRATKGRAFARCNVLGRYFQDHLDVSVGRIQPVDRAQTSHLFGSRVTPSARRRLHLELTPHAQEEDRVAGAFAHVESDIRNQAIIRALTKLVEQRGAGFSAADLRAIVQNAGGIARHAYWWAVKKNLLFPEGTQLDLRICAEQVPHWDNRILLSEERDALGVPKARLIWQPMATEERTLRACVTRLSRYWKETGFDRICPVEWSAAAQNPSLPLIDEAKDWFHPSGTTRMGTRPDDSVVGPDLICHDLPNVSVLSASVFPTAGVSNPTLTLMRLAFHCADQVLKRTGIEGGGAAWRKSPPKAGAGGPGQSEVR